MEPGWFVAPGKEKLRATSLVGSVRIIICMKSVLFLLQKLSKSPEN